MIKFHDEILVGDPRYRISDNAGNVHLDNAQIELKNTVTEETALVTTTTTFNSDGSITEVSTDSNNNTITRTTVFNSDGTIEITIT